MQCDTVNMEELIRQEFAKYGSITAVKMLNHPTEYEEEVIVELCEAYVTFCQTNSAYNAFMAHRRGEFPIEVETVFPADTWQQEIPWRQSVKDSSDIPGLASDDLHSVVVRIKKEDGGVKEQYAHLLMKNEPPFQLENKLLVDIDADVSMKTWLMLARDLKDDLEYIYLKFSSKSNETNSNSLTIEEYEKRVVQVMAKESVGEYFQAMTIDSKRPIPWEILHSMAPLLNRLVSLIVKNPLKACLLYTLPTLCPHLRMLRLSGDWDADCRDELATNWPSLRVLALTHNRLDLRSSVDDGKKFHSFISENPQLESLMLETTIDIELLNAIVENLGNIKQLSFRRPSYYHSISLLDCLTQADSLESITITFDEAEADDLENIAVAAAHLGQMENIKLVTLIQNYMPNTENKEKFAKLSKFPVTEHRNCGCHYNQRFLNFDDVIADIEIPQDVPILVIVINTNHPDKSQDKTLQHDILNMLEKTKPSFPEFIRLEVVKRNNHYVYVHIARAEMYTGYDYDDDDDDDW